jgi:hypothetical protein
MKRRAPSPVNGDLFGHKGPTPKDTTPVSVPLMHHPAGSTDKAWMLSKPGRGNAPKHAPRSLVTEGEGPNAGIFTMPRWIALERGWLT